jgi:hydroxyethylthiazole kinase
MAHAIEEVQEMVSKAGALVLNPGTLSQEWITSMISAAQSANIPVILDPVCVIILNVT